MAEGSKITFGHRRVGRHTKRIKPKTGRRKLYNRQGR